MLGNNTRIFQVLNLKAIYSALQSLQAIGDGYLSFHYIHTLCAAVIGSFKETLQLLVMEDNARN